MEPENDQLSNILIWKNLKYREETLFSFMLLKGNMKEMVSYEDINSYLRRVFCLTVPYVQMMCFCHFYPSLPSVPLSPAGSLLLTQSPSYFHVLFLCVAH